MVDDHPLQIEGYKVILSGRRGIDITFTECYSCEKAYGVITGRNKGFDVAFIDYNMPRWNDIESGADLARIVRAHLPGCKIVVITAHCESFLLYNLVRTVSPEGLWVKSDFGPAGLLAAFSAVMEGETNYTDTVSSGIRRMLSNGRYLDVYNRQIITLLSKGVRTRNMPNFLHLSLSAIEKRKAQVRDYFCLDKGSDEDIVREARRQGYI